VSDEPKTSERRRTGDDISSKQMVRVKGTLMIVDNMKSTESVMDADSKVSAIVFTATWLLALIREAANPRIYKEDIFKASAEKFLKAINAINSLDCEVSKLGIYDIDDFKILKGLEFLIMPKQLKMVDSFLYKDLLIRPSVEYNGLTPDEFQAIQMMMADCLRIRDKVFTSVSDYRKALVLSDELLNSGLSDGKMAIYSDSKQLPLVVDPVIFDISWKYPIFNVSYNQLCHDIALRGIRDLLGVA
jgi:hypothetical protein